MTAPGTNLDLEALLGRMAAEISWPAGGVDAARLMDAIEPPRQAGFLGRRPLGATVATLAVLLFAFLAGIAVSNEAREAIADFLGLGVAGERIEILRDEPVEGVELWPAADSAVAEISADEAAALLGQPPLLPDDDAVRFYSLAFRELQGIVVRTARYDVWEFRAEEVLLGKMGYEGSTSVTNVNVDGRTGYWVTGGPRVLTVLDASGEPVTGIGVVTNTNALVFSDGPLTLRVEGDTSLEEALAVAKALLE